MTHLSKLKKVRPTGVLKSLESTRDRSLVVFSIILAALILIGLGFAVPYLLKADIRKTPTSRTGRGARDDVRLRMAQRTPLVRENPLESSARPAIPPIDAAAPADVKTATFALG